MTTLWIIEIALSSHANHVLLTVDPVQAQMNRSTGLTISQISQSDTREVGTCEVCDNDHVGVIKSTGRLRKHGPRSAPCSGYNSLPVVGSVRLRDVNAPGRSTQDDIEDVNDADSSRTPADANSDSSNTDDCGPILILLCPPLRY